MKGRLAVTLGFAAGLFLSACAAVGVPASDDPWQKYLHGCALLEVGRVSPAQRLLSESLEHYERAGDPMRLGAVQAAYATVIESPTFVIHPLFRERRMALGGREALPARARELRIKARDNVERAQASPSADASAAERAQAAILLERLKARLAGSY